MNWILEAAAGLCLLYYGHLWRSRDFPFHFPCSGRSAPLFLDCLQWDAAIMRDTENRFLSGRP